MGRRRALDKLSSMLLSSPGQKILAVVQHGKTLPIAEVVHNLGCLWAHPGCKMKHTGQPSLPPLTRGEAGSQPLTTASPSHAGVSSHNGFADEQELAWSPFLLVQYSCAELVAGSGVRSWLASERD